ncbi:hypothetical protein HanRHA438_Chr04g0162901 [Helianthus annuus]|uniref:Uncharacterized protein n=1 Tax=Helianthus annuus TaxID=4232 RepID=A0A9K3NRQ9_HELAN|nr:hypothetical protein HanXRQr2_Chr04g0152741 [Helianthus annuus]KAJ0925720.1 hypothetical protein HanRHA438_Chr04g0162901 [Helianthus annuus]KAJ0930243.1 hypothetical protein HanPSC8_Chr04g0147081 [Helianthus annuus]
MPTRMGFQSLCGMGLIKRFDVIGVWFKNHAGVLWIAQDLPEQFDLVYPPSDPAVVLVPDPPMNLDSPAMPQPPPPPGALSFHVTLFQVIVRELQYIRRYEPSLTGSTI